jgi:hypothetical protein
VNAHRLPILLVCRNVRGSQVDSSRDGVPPPGWRHRPINRCAIDGKTEDHGNVLQHHRDLPTWKVERVGLRTSPVYKCHQRGRVHHRPMAGHDTSKRQEPDTPYEWRIPLIPRQGAVRTDPEWQESLCNTTMI